MSTSNNQPVLVGIDGSRAALAAVRWAAVDAAHRHVPLHIIDAIGAQIDLGPGIGIPQVDFSEFRQDGLAALDIAHKTAVEASSPIREIHITTQLVEVPPIPVLCDRSATARMLVVGTRGLGAFGRGLLGSVSTAVARHAGCPVAVIPEAPERFEGPVVVGVDGSTHSVRAIEIAFDQAAHRGTGLVAVHTWSELFHYKSHSELQHEGEALLAQNLAGYSEKYPEVSVRRVVDGAKPAKRLLDEGETAQLIVVGSHGRGGFAGMTLGSVSQAVLHAATVPVIIARSVS
ncbi:universal stress protein [Nocardia sp. CNY236]|uniref:universal stress protein n=1 Tax=Nocardia sp. CNY236 TaxID=1169152 RepID=UPI0003F86C81|nr:universal stress protein [Nocardia sp. CNY236]